MKKSKLFSLLSLIILTCILCICAAACGGKRLASPSDITVGDNYELTWSSVAHAKGYVVELIDGEGKKTELTPTSAKVSLSDQPLGDYYIRIKAVAKDRQNRDSEWSPFIDFQKTYQTGCRYRLINNNSEYEIVKAGAAKEVVVLEDMYRGKPVTRIADNAFKQSKSLITDITVGKYVTYIGKNAFYNCKQLVKVVLPESVEYIGDSAFQNCQLLESIEIPAGIEQISPYMFHNCKSLKFISVPEGITAIGESAFGDCMSLTELVIPDSVLTISAYAFKGNTSVVALTLGNGVTTIGEYAFYGCSLLAEIGFGDKLETISLYAFADCKELREIAPKEGLKSIEACAFKDDEKLEKISIPSTTTAVASNAFSNTKTVNGQEKEKYVYVDKWVVGVRKDVFEELEEINSETFAADTVGIGNALFAKSEKLRTVDLRNTSIKFIGNQAFSACPVLGRRLYIGNVESIGSYAFYKCTLLTRIVAEGHLKTIGDYAFYDSSLESISGLENVTKIGTFAFKNTTLWKNPDDQGVVYAGNWVVGYQGNKNLGTITLKDETVGIADYAFMDCSSLTGISGLSQASLKYIGYGAFWDCAKLQSANLGNNVSCIEPRTFSGCASLSSVGLSKQLTSIGASAFYDCKSLVRVDLSGTKVNAIGHHAFYGCENLQGINFGDTVTEIGSYAFYKNGLREVTLPDSLKTVGNRAFSKCSFLTTAEFGNGLEAIGEYAFSSCKLLSEIVLPDSLKTIGGGAFYDCVAVNRLVLGEGLEKIGDYAFHAVGASEKGVRSLSLPKSVKEIGNGAFKDCVSVEYISFGANVEKIGRHAFYGCNATIYTEAEAVPESWSIRWNSSFLPVVSGCVLSEDGAVLSVTLKEKTLWNNNEYGEFTSPVRDGYKFEGWATSADAGEAQYSAEEIVSVPNGTALYAVWTKISDQPIEQPETEQPPEA